jgi:hypothetical protein
MTRRPCYGLVTLIRPGRLLNNTIIMGISSIGRAAVFGTEGSRFESWIPSH